MRPLLLGTDWGEGSLTESGYPFIIKRWRRGQPLAAATEIFRGSPRDVGMFPARFRDRDGSVALVLVRGETFFESTFQLVDGDRLVPLPLPRRSEVVALWSGELVVALQEDWKVGETIFHSGSLVSFSLAQFVQYRHAGRQAGLPAGTARFVPGVPRQPIAGVPAHCGKRRHPGLPLRVSRRPVAPARSARAATAQPGQVRQRACLTMIGPLSTRKGSSHPCSLFPAEPGKRCRSSPTCPPASMRVACVVDQYEASSKDGTKVPYFVVRPKDMKLDGTAPTLLYGYGGFQISMTPAYSGTLGKLWLENGGVYVLANIRGGGEFGPAWHQAGLKTKRQLIYDDFIAVAEDLIERRITSPRRLGIMGGSNGGLLMGVALTQRPDLWNAVVIQVPLLDMLRYDQMLAGASWVDEYGSPSVPEERAFLEKISPYQNLKAGVAYPPPFFVTSTKDDRVHPGHARKMAAKMADLNALLLLREHRWRPCRRRGPAGARETRGARVHVSCASPEGLTPCPRGRRMRAGRSRPTDDRFRRVLPRASEPCADRRGSVGRAARA